MIPGNASPASSTKAEKNAVCIAEGISTYAHTHTHTHTHTHAHADNHPHTDTDAHTCTHTRARARWHTNTNTNTRPVFGLIRRLNHSSFLDAWMERKSDIP